MLKIENITKSINSNELRSNALRNKNIIDNLSLQVNNGEIAVLLGSSGVGKSTLLRILNNLETKDSGVIYLNGKQLNLNKINQDHTVGFVFQHFNLFEHLNVKENITLALEKVLNKTPEQASSIALDLLKKYGLEDKANYSVSKLSGGQKQRLAIARTLALKPTIVCFDEPTSALDPLLSSYVAENIKQLAQDGYIVIVATHDTNLLQKLSCTIHLMRNGNIIESAKSNNFYENKSQYPNIEKFISGQY